MEQNVTDRSYVRYAERAIAALERRERQAVEHIRRAARQAGLSESNVNETLISSGLVERPQPPAPQRSASPAAQITLEGVAEQLTALNQRVDQAARAASRHGVSF